MSPRLQECTTWLLVIKMGLRGQWLEHWQGAPEAPSLSPSCILIFKQLLHMWCCFGDIYIYQDINCVTRKIYTDLSGTGQPCRLSEACQSGLDGGWLCSSRSPGRGDRRPRGTHHGYPAQGRWRCWGTRTAGAVKCCQCSVHSFVGQGYYLAHVGHCLYVKV